MANVTFVTSICDEFTQGIEAVEVTAETVFQLVRALDARFPGLGDFIEKRASIAVDGEVVQLWTHALTTQSDVFLFPKIGGGLVSVQGQASGVVPSSPRYR